MIFLCAQPDIPFYHWQVETVIYNFTRLGIDSSKLHFVFSGEFPSPGANILINRYPAITFHFYPDTRTDRSYIPSIRPHILNKHFTKFPELNSEVVFYHDCDIIFRELPDFERMIHDDVWYLSDTNSYINSTYIKSKGYEIFQKMCEIVGVGVDQIEAIDQHSGGAQYLMKGISAEYWAKVEKDCSALYKYMTESIPHFTQKFDQENTVPNLKYHPIQAWCADMWAVLWNGVYLGKTIKVDKNLDFSWATSPVQEYERCTIFHNAGVTPTLGNFKELFYKGEFQQKTPFNWDLSYVTPTSGSYFYVQEILATKKFIAENFSN